MTSTAIMAPGLSGVLRMTWLHDDLAHVLEHEIDEPSGTWTGLACRDHNLPLSSDVDNATLRRLAADGKIADLVWEAPEELATEHAHAFQTAMQAYHAGNSELAEQHWQTFSPIKPQRWVIASFEHHCGPHGLPHPHVHNIVMTSLTTGIQPTDTGARGQYKSAGSGRVRRG